MDVSFNEILAQLSLGSDPGPIFNIQLYILFFLNLVAFFMQSEKQLAATLFCGGALALIVISKLNLIDPESIFALLINVGIFIIPIFVTGMSKAKGSKPITGLAGLLGGVYFFSFWFILQRASDL